MSAESLALIDKALGNIKAAHKALTFVGLLEHTPAGKVSLLHYHYTPSNHSTGSVLGHQPT
jgi:hypothetical protein